MAVDDVYFLVLHEPYETAEHPRPINATVVHALTLLHKGIPQPDGGLMYRCLTEFPSRTPGCLVPLSTLSFELDGGGLWPRIADWPEVVNAVVRLARSRQCDAMHLGLPELATVLLSQGPKTTVDAYTRIGHLVVGSAERQQHLDALTEQVRAAVAQGPFWPGDDLVAVPKVPPTMPYKPVGAGE